MGAGEGAGTLVWSVESLSLVPEYNSWRSLVVVNRVLVAFALKTSPLGAEGGSTLSEECLGPEFSSCCRQDL